MDDPQFVTRADAARLAHAVSRFRGRVGGDTTRLLKRCVHEFGHLDPPERLALLHLTALQDGLPGLQGTRHSGAPWVPSWTAWRPGAALMTLIGHAGGVWAVAFSPDSTTLATASSDQTVRLWEAATGQHTATLTGHTGVVMGVAFSPDSTTLATASYDQTVRLWATATGQHTATLTGHTVVTAVAFSPDGATLATASYDQTVRLWDPATGQHTATLTGHT
ncbi:MAG: WD40 repeat domain-containing protein, partial [Egibacteraceae bacterium]